MNSPATIRRQIAGYVITGLASVAALLSTGCSGDQAASSLAPQLRGAEATAATTTDNYLLTVYRTPAEGGTARFSPVPIDPVIDRSYYQTRIYPLGQAVTVTPVPASGFRFKNWERDGVYYGTTPTFTLTMAGNERLTMVYEQTKATFLSTNEVTLYSTRPSERDTNALAVGRYPAIPIDIRCLIQFDTTAIMRFIAGRSIKSAMLTMYVTKAPTLKDGQYRIMPISSAWTQQTVSYASQPATYSAASVYFDQGMTVRATMTTFVKNWASRTWKPNGLIIKEETSQNSIVNYEAIAASGATVRPSLQIELN